MSETYEITDTTIALRNCQHYLDKMVALQARMLITEGRPPYAEIMRLWQKELLMLDYWLSKLAVSTGHTFTSIETRTCKACGIEIVDSRVYCDGCIAEGNV